MRFILLILFSLSFKVFSQDIKSTDTSFTEPGHIQSVTYKTNQERDSIVYLYPKRGTRSIFIPKGKGSLGTWIEYDKEGYKSSEWTVNDNKLNGLSIRYHKNGQINTKDLYVDGRREGNSTAYYENGVERFRCKYEDNEMEGELKYYYTNGNLMWKGEFKKGKMSGERVYYDEKGNFINGAFTIKNQAGQIEREGSCVNGKPEGELKVYNVFNGTVAVLSKFKDGLPHGLTTFYGLDGKVTRGELYHMGKFEGLMKLDEKK